MKNKDTTLKEYLDKTKTKYVFYAVAFTVGIVAYIFFIKTDITYDSAPIHVKVMGYLMCALVIWGIVYTLYKNRIKKEIISRLWFARTNPHHPKAYEIVKHVLEKYSSEYSDYRLGEKETDKEAIELANIIKEYFTGEYSPYGFNYKSENIDDYIIEEFPDTPFAEAFGEGRYIGSGLDGNGKESSLYKSLAKKYPNSALAKGVTRNNSYDLTKEDIEFMMKEPDSILTKGLVYQDRNSAYLYLPSLYSRLSTAERIYSREIDIAVNEDLRKLILRYPDSPFSMWFFSSDEYKIGAEEHKLLWGGENKFFLECLKSSITVAIYVRALDKLKRDFSGTTFYSPEINSKLQKMRFLHSLNKLNEIVVDFEYAWHITRNYSYQITKEDIEQIRNYPSSCFAHGVCDNEGSIIYAKQIDESIGIDYKLVAWLNPYSKFAQALVENELYTIEEIDMLVANTNDLSNFANAVKEKSTKKAAPEKATLFTG